MDIKKHFVGRDGFIWWVGQVVDETTWASFINDRESDGGGSMIGYIPKKRQLLVVKDSDNITDSGDMYLYDMVTQSWVMGIDQFTGAAERTKSNFIVDFNGDLIYSSFTGSTSLLKKWTDTATQTLPKVITKDIDFGTPSQKKSVKKVYISYKGDASSVTVLYGKDGLIPASNFYKTGADGSTTNATDSATPFYGSTVGTDDWVCAELKPVAGSITCNSFRIAIDGTAGTDFEINDISVVYRPKSVK